MNADWLLHANAAGAAWAGGIALLVLVIVIGLQKWFR